MQGGKEDVSKRFVPGSGAKFSLKAFLERQHPGVPSMLLDPKAPAPWRSSPSRTTKPSPKQAPAPRSAGSACPKEEFSPRYAALSAQPTLKCTIIPCGWASQQRPRHFHPWKAERSLMLGLHKH